MPITEADRTAEAQAPKDWPTKRAGDVEVGDRVVVARMATTVTNVQHADSGAVIGIAGSAVRIDTQDDGSHYFAADDVVRLAL